MYEQRISRMLGIIQHHVTYRNAMVAKRNSERIEHVLFVIAVLSAFSSLSHVHGLGNLLLGMPWGGPGFIIGAAVFALFISIWFRGIRRRRTPLGPASADSAID